MRCGAAVAELAPTAGGAWEVAVDGGTLLAQQVVLATDAPAAHRLLSASALAPETLAAVTWPEGQPSAVIRLWFDVTPETDAEGGMFGGANYTLDNFFWVHRIQEAFKTWHDETGGSALECHIYGPPDLLAESDEATAVGSSSRRAGRLAGRTAWLDRLPRGAPVAAAGAGVRRRLAWRDSAILSLMNLALVLACVGLVPVTTLSGRHWHAGVGDYLNAWVYGLPAASPLSRCPCC